MGDVAAGTGFPPRQWLVAGGGGGGGGIGRERERWILLKPPSEREV